MAPTLKNTLSVSETGITDGPITSWPALENVTHLLSLTLSLTGFGSAIAAAAASSLHLLSKLRCYFSLCFNHFFWPHQKAPFIKLTWSLTYFYRNLFFCSVSNKSPIISPFYLHGSPRSFGSTNHPFLI